MGRLNARRSLVNSLRCRYMAIIRCGSKRKWIQPGESDAYVFIGADNELHIGDAGSEDETEMVTLSPEDTTEIVCRLLDRAEAEEDIKEIRDALVEYLGQSDKPMFDTDRVRDSRGEDIEKEQKTARSLELDDDNAGDESN